MFQERCLHTLSIMACVGTALAFAGGTVAALEDNPLSLARLLQGYTLMGLEFLLMNFALPPVEISRNFNIICGLFNVLGLSLACMSVDNFKMGDTLIKTSTTALVCSSGFVTNLPFLGAWLQSGYQAVSQYCAVQTTPPEAELGV